MYKMILFETSRLQQSKTNMFMNVTKASRKLNYEKRITKIKQTK